MAKERAYIGLGSSLGDRLAILREAVRSIAQERVQGLRLVACSRVYETRPVGAAKNRFLNAVIEVETDLEAARLLKRLHTLETEHGRVRRVRWEDRNLDLDLLWMSKGGETLSLDEDEVRVPHPELTFRDFVLAPLVDLAPTLDLRGLTARETLDALADGQRTIEAILLAPLMPTS